MLGAFWRVCRVVPGEFYQIPGVFNRGVLIFGFFMQILVRVLVAKRQ